MHQKGPAENSEALQYPLTPEVLTVIFLWLRSYKRGFGAQTSLTIPQFTVLDLLDSNGGNLQPKQIARSLRLNPSTITTTVDNLETRGLVTRKIDEDNRRVIRVQRTPEAVPLIEEGRQCVVAITHQLIAPLGDFLKQLLDEAAETVFETSFTKSEEQILNRLGFYHVSLFSGLLLEELFKRENLTMLEFRILFALVNQSQRVRVSDLSRMLLVLFPDITTACNALEKRSMLNRQRDPRDRRATLLDITNIGYEQFSRVAPQADAILMDVASHLDKSTRQLSIKAAHLIIKEQRRRFRPE